MEVEPGNDLVQIFRDDDPQIVVHKIQRIADLLAEATARCILTARDPDNAAYAKAQWALERLYVQLEGVKGQCSELLYTPEYWGAEANDNEGCE